MGEIVARTLNDGLVELLNIKAGSVAALEPMTAKDAAYLARGLLCCAAIQSVDQPLPPGTIGTDAQLPILAWTIGHSRPEEGVIVSLTVLPGVELTFRIPADTAKEFAKILLPLAEQLDGTMESHGPLN